MRTNHHALIDQLAREMTDVDPSPDFSRRVVSNLKRRGPVPTRWFVVVAAGAAVIAAVTIMPRAGRDQQLPGSQPSVASTLHSPLLATSTLAPLSTVPNRARTLRVVTANPTTEELAWASRAVPALGAANPIPLDAIQPERPTIAPITVESLTTAPITLPPIDPRSGGRH